MQCANLLPPAEDINALWNLGVAGVPFAQYLRWADDLNIFVTLADRNSLTAAELEPLTPLSARGIDAFLGVLCSLNVVAHRDAAYQLTKLGREYLDRRSAYYVGPAFYGMLQAPLPPRFTKGEKIRHFSALNASLIHKLRYFFSAREMGRPERLAVQHSRNFAAAVAAVHSGMFSGVRHLVDIGGGSGVFAIPLALMQQHTAITLVDLPLALPHVAGFLARYGVSERVTLLGLNVHVPPWPVEAADGILFGNFLHFCSDAECRTLLKEAHRLLSADGRLFIHEMLWNANKDGPLVTALWNFWMISVSAGRQRTRNELDALLTQAGFGRLQVQETAGAFSMLICQKDG